MIKKVSRYCAITLLTTLVAAPLFAQEVTIRDGVFTEAQATEGKLVFDNTCGGCHDMRFYQEALRKRAGRPLIELWEQLLAEMPGDNPGSLSDDEYTTVIAYILSMNGFPAGEATLDPNNGMGQIKVVAP